MASDATVARAAKSITPWPVVRDGRRGALGRDPASSPSSPTAGRNSAIAASAGGRWRMCHRTDPARPGGLAAPRPTGQARHGWARDGWAGSRAVPAGARGQVWSGGPRDRAAPAPGEGRAANPAGTSRPAPGRSEPRILRSSSARRSAQIRNTYRTACALPASINALRLMWPFTADIMPFVTVSIFPLGCRNQSVGASPPGRYQPQQPHVFHDQGGRAALTNRHHATPAGASKERFQAQACTVAGCGAGGRVMTYPVPALAPGSAGVRARTMFHLSHAA